MHMPMPESIGPVNANHISPHRGSVMIEAYFGFKRLPFAKEIKPDQLFESYDTREAKARLNYIRQHRGFFHLLVSLGVGKLHF